MILKRRIRRIRRMGVQLPCQQFVLIFCEFSQHTTHSIETVLRVKRSGVISIPFVYAPIYSIFVHFRHRFMPLFLVILCFLVFMFWKRLHAGHVVSYVNINNLVF
ncbi:hypothetical protein BDR07DRAFT_1435869 [Suillus spraguei]|nr:hypothetical protein BDR07DRAFT_1435869 [Suillus spraguei]